MGIEDPVANESYRTSHTVERKVLPDVDVLLTGLAIAVCKDGLISEP